MIVSCLNSVNNALACVVKTEFVEFVLLDN